MPRTVVPRNFFISLDGFRDCVAIERSIWECRASTGQARSLRGPVSPYINSMDKAHLAKIETTVRDFESRRTLTLRGAGALKGQSTLRKSIDLTKPITLQRLQGVKTRKAADAHSTH